MGNKQSQAPVVTLEELEDSHDFGPLQGMFDALLAPGGGAGQGAKELSKDQFMAQLAPLLGKSWGRGYLERLFVAANHGGGGGMRFSDYATAMYVLGCGTKAQRYKLLFNMCNWDSSEFISTKNLAKLLSLGLPAPPDGNAWPVVVTRHDPATDAITEETEKLDLDDVSPLVDSMVLAAMIQYDRDEDGKLNFEEWCGFAAECLTIQVLLDAVDACEESQAPWHVIRKKEN